MCVLRSPMVKWPLTLKVGGGGGGRQRSNNTGKQLKAQKDPNACDKEKAQSLDSPPASERRHLASVHVIGAHARGCNAPPVNTPPC